jgi:hypothetical protein
MLLGAILLWSLVLVMPFHSATEAAMAQIKYGSNVLTVRLDENQEMTFSGDNDGYNTVTIRDGKIAVTEANCPDHYCIDRGFVSGGTPIVCLPNALVIEFTGEQEVDGMVG